VAGPGHRGVKSQVLLKEGLVVSAAPAGGVERAVHLGQVFVGAALGRQGRHVGLDDETGLHELPERGGAGAQQQ
jgi:hypothetical protein